MVQCGAVQNSVVQCVACCAVMQCVAMQSFVDTHVATSTLDGVFICECGGCVRERESVYMRVCV